MQSGQGKEGELCVGLVLWGQRYLEVMPHSPSGMAQLLCLGGVSGYREVLLPVRLLPWSSPGPPGSFWQGAWQLILRLGVPSWATRILLQETFLSGIYSTMLGLPKGGPHRRPAAGM